MKECSFRNWLVDLLSNRRNFHEELLEKAHSRKYVVFYGCGTVFKSIVPLWNSSVDVKIDFCCDTSSSKWGTEFCGIPCISPNQLSEIGHESVVFITANDCLRIYSNLKEIVGLEVCEIYKYDFRYADYFKSGDFDSNLDVVVSNLDQVYSMLADEPSRTVFRTVLMRIFNREAKFVMSSVNTPDEYFPEGIVALADKECFVDAGAYTGDTLRFFLSKVDAKFEYYYAFEMDQPNFAILKENVHSMDCRERVRLYNLGLMDKCAVMNYNSMGMGSAICGDGEKYASVTTLDDVLPEERVTFIKMDIEGSELRALSGARRIIHEQTPVLAICVYHKFEDLWEIPQYINNASSQYSIYFRHHSNIDDDTICYAVRK